MAVTKGKDTKDERQASLIPIIERQEQQLRTEVEQVRQGAKNQIHQAEKRAEQNIQQGQLNISKLVEQRRKEELVKLQKKAEQLSQSWEQHKAHLQQRVKRNMARAVQSVVDTVTAVGDEM